MMPFVDYSFDGSSWNLLLRLFFAAMAGALIGIEREKHGRPAGLRTHLLVALGSCLMMIISESFYHKYGSLSGTGVVRVDPSRVAAQIVAGIGFVGAGVVIKEGMTVRGLTTAACLWMAAGIGMGFGMGIYGPTLVATFLGLLSLIFLKKLEPYIKKDRFLTFSVLIDGGRDVYPELEAVFASCSMKISDVACDYDVRSGEVCYEFILTQHRKRMGRDLGEAVAKIPGVRKIQYK